MVQDGELKRRYIYTDSKTKQYVATIYLDCKVEKGVADTNTFLSFMFTPFAVVDGLDLGLSLAPLDGGRPAPVGVIVTSVDDGKGCLMSPRTPQGLGYFFPTCSVANSSSSGSSKAQSSSLTCRFTMTPNSRAFIARRPKSSGRRKAGLVAGSQKGGRLSSSGRREMALAVRLASSRDR